MSDREQRRAVQAAAHQERPMTDTYIQGARALAVLNSDRPAVDLMLRSLAKEVKRLREEKADLQIHADRCEDSWNKVNVVKNELYEEVEELKAEVAWLETPMRARHKALIAALEAEEDVLQYPDIVAAFEACKR